MHKLCFIGLIVSLLGGLVSCNSAVSPDTTATAVLDSNKTDILTYAASQSLVGTMTGSGLYFVLNKPGSSTVTPAFGQELEFNYTLYLLNGPSNTTVTSGVTDALIDTSAAITPLFYPFFTHAFSAGLEEAFLRMHEGDQVTLLIPSALAFGNVTTKDPVVPVNSPVRYDITLRRARTEDQQIDEYVAANKLTVTETTASGLRFIKTRSNATGALPTVNQTLTLKSSGKLLRYTAPFDSTGSAYSTSLGKSAMAGFNEGVAKLRVGEKVTLIFPSSLGYKSVGISNSSNYYIVAPYTPLRYDVELISVQ